LIATNRLEDARALTEQAVAELTIAGCDRQALTAMAYLRDLVPKPEQRQETFKGARAPGVAKRGFKPYQESGIALSSKGHESIETKEGLFALMEQIAEEREAARPIVEQLAASDPPPEDIEIPDEWRTAGMVLELCEKAYSLDEAAPKTSLTLGHLALILST